jgi:antitoxin PrlF
LKEISTTITQRGQVTIPAEVRRLLGAKPRDKIVFRIEGSAVTLAPAAFDLESAYGSVTPLDQPEDFTKISRIAREDKIARVRPEAPRQ